jgi:phage baseplate assembly protein gpV
MSDYNSSLPVRTEAAGDVIIKVADATTPSQQLAVEADGSINVNFAPGAEIKITDGTDDLAINADGSINTIVSATNLDIRDLAFATDKVDVSGSSVSVSGSVTVSDGGGSLTVDAVNLDIRDLVFATDKVDVSGSSIALDAPTLAALESVTVQNGAGASAVNIQDGGNSITVDANNLDIRDLTHVSDSVKIGDGTDFLAVNTDGSINVKISDSSPGTAITSYNTVASVAGGANSTHTYTSTGNFYLTQVEASGSGKLKIEIQVNGTTRFVQFNSTSNPNMSIQLSQPILATSGQTVTVIRTNRENQSQDVYSTISGYNE